MKHVKTKTTHKTITENGDKVQIEMYMKIEKEQYKKEYTKRSTVEGPFRTLKEHYHIENKIIIGKTKQKKE